MAKIDGIVSEAGTLRSKKRLLVTNEESGQVEEHLIPHGKHVLVQPGDFAQKGQLITEGAKDPHEILEILGPSAVQEYLIEEIQKVYRLQGVTINDKHLEVIISRMLFKVRITDPGDTDFFWGDQVDRFAFMDSNEEISEKGGKPAEGEPILLGIAKLPWKRTVSSPPLPFRKPLEFSRMPLHLVKLMNLKVLRKMS